jgi:hypothetical protein
VTDAVAVLDLALAAGLVCAAVVALRRLTFFHPATLWLLPWAIATTLFALHALPYRALSAATILIIAGWTALFCVGTLLGSRVTGVRPLRPWIHGLRTGAPALEPAAALAVVLAAAGLAAFLLQVASGYGWRAAIISDAHVRLAIGEGATTYTIKYVYVAFAAAALSGMAAGRADAAARRRAWIAVALAAIGMQYFSTGRSNIVLAAVMAWVAYAMTDPRPLRLARALLLAAAVGSSTLAIFLGMGTLLDKSFATSDMRTFDNTFVRHEALRPLALPYQYVTAPLPAFDILRAATPRSGRGGCRTLSPACAIGQRLGLPVAPEPSLTGFTGEPAPWNTFTALYAPLVDAGALLGSVVILAEGVLFGLLWAAARTGSVYTVCAYAAMSSAVAYSTVENTLLAPHLIGAALIAIGLTAAASRVRPPAFGRRERQPADLHS